LTGVFRQTGLWIEKVRPKRPAIHEEMNDAFRLRHEMSARRSLQGRSEAQRAHAATHAGQQLTA
jgi:hypothetical protein